LANRALLTSRRCCQIGRIGDALIVPLAHFHPQSPLTSEETAAIAALKKMFNEVADVKQKPRTVRCVPAS
jgi:hypothetical protein